MAKTQKTTAKTPAPTQTAPAKTAPAPTPAPATPAAEGATTETKASKPRYAAVPADFNGFTVKLLVTGNPKVKGSKSYPRFDLYKSGMTIQEYVDASVQAGNKAGLAKADLRWDHAHGFITFEPKAKAS